MKRERTQVVRWMSGYGRLPNALLASTLMLLAATPSASGQEERKTETLIADGDHGYMIALEAKLTEVDGRFANFLGVSGGWLIEKRFLLGGGIYGKTTCIDEFQMGYGGLLMEYFFNPDRLINFSAKALIGGGSASRWWSDPFFVAEPEGRVTLNITEWLRIGAGGGYRFVRSSCDNDGLSGPTASIQLKFGSF